MTKMWMVRAGRESIYIDEFSSEGIVAIGWDKLGYIEKGTSKSTLIRIYKNAYPHQSSGQIQNGASQVVRFINDLAIGDFVVTYDRDRRLYLLGQIESDSVWQPTLLTDEMPNIRHVNWTHKIARDRLSASSKNTLGAIQTLFEIKGKVAKELREKSIPIDATEESVETIKNIDEQNAEIDALVEQETRAELLGQVEESIQDRIAQLDWESMQELVAGILRAMGYRTVVSPRGADRGVDIFASPDGLGLEEPRIFVEVKHRPSQSMGSQNVRSFLGGRSNNDKCLYVSTGGFTKDARYEADRSNIPLRLLTLVDLRKLLVEHYENLDEGVRSLIPLKRVYVLAD